MKFILALLLTAALSFSPGYQVKTGAEVYAVLEDPQQVFIIKKRSR